MESMTFLVVVEREGNVFGAYPPDLPGVGVTADTEEEALRLVREAIAFHLEGLRAEGEPVPPATSKAEVVKV